MLQSETIPSEIPMVKHSSVVRLLLALMCKEEKDILKLGWLSSMTIYQETYRAVVRYQIFKHNRLLNGIFAESFASRYPKEGFILACQLRQLPNARIALGHFGQTAAGSTDNQWLWTPNWAWSPWNQEGRGICKVIGQDIARVWTAICIGCSEVSRTIPSQERRSTTGLSHKEVVVNWPEVAERFAFAIQRDDLVSGLVE